MKCMVVLAAILAVAAPAAVGPGYRGFASASASASSFARSSASATASRIAPAPAPARAAASSPAVSRGSSPDATAEIVRYENDLSPDGTYRYLVETSNGISAQESGAPRSVGGETPIAAEGSFAYTAPGGEAISLTYVADENGFQPQGEAIPTPPPVPAAIVRALEWIQAHPYTEPK